MKVGEYQDLLVGKKVIVTGAARGIGKGIAIECIRNGAQVVVLDVDKPLLDQVVVELNGIKKNSATAFHADISSEKDVIDAFSFSFENLGGVDGVVINAGILHLAPVEQIELAEWNRVINVNLTGSFLCAKEAVRQMKKSNNRGSIVFTSSLFGLRGGAENGAYSASKFGVIGLAQSLAAELGPLGIRVNSICPGQVQTEMIDRLLEDRSSLTGRSSEEVRKNLVARIPSQKMGTITEIAEPYVFLLSEMSRYVTGHSLLVDGGWQVG